MSYKHLGEFVYVNIIMLFTYTFKYTNHPVENLEYTRSNNNYFNEKQFYHNF